MSDLQALLRSVDEVTMESELSVLTSLSHVYAKQADMISRCTDLTGLEAVFAEADTSPADQSPSGSGKKKSILRRMIEAVKKFFSLIARSIKFIIKAVANVFRKSGSKKTMDQILEECGFKPRHGKSSANTNDGGPAAKKYHIAFKTQDQFIIKFNKYWQEKQRTGSAQRKRSTGSESAPIYQQAARGDWRAVDLLINEKYRNALFGYISAFINFLTQSITTASSQDIYAIKAKWDAVLRAYDRIPPTPVDNKEYLISYNDLTEVQGKVNILQKEFDTINYEQYDAMLEKLSTSDRNWFNREVSGRMGDLTSRLNNIQMSFNELSNEIMHVFDLPKEYHGTVSTPEALEVFVKHCIEGGIPPRYVIHGVVKISTEELCGSNHPSGQSRVVLFPKNDPSNVYKVAYNGFGISSNKAEIAVSKYIVAKAKDAARTLIAPITHVYGDGYVIAMERAKGNKPSSSILEDLIDRFDDFAAKTNWSVLSGATTDLHEKNVSQLLSGEWVAIDYGWSARGEQSAEPSSTKQSTPTSKKSV